MISSVGILSIRGTRDSGVIAAMEDPMAILQKGYSITIFLAVVTFGLVILSFSLEFLNIFISTSGRVLMICGNSKRSK